ncbi:threonine synthase [Candidatus Vidania fulgoroideae]|uniref:Threonine synthase n=1 Tax=Candidatus Vidania fulgoroideorum TaxID=881286 RepID=A0AAX3NAL0_9PROT|nr:threonine synthase [Candidatus Vidania fulgoroideae]
MKYISTRKGDKKSFSKIIKNNMSSGGLYVPYFFPKIRKKLKKIKNYNFKDIVNYIFKIFLTKNEYKHYSIKKICNNIFKKKNFPLDKNIVSLKKIKKKLFLLKISNGKSFSFKDIAMCFISKIFKYNIKKNVICATSGDTGSSCATFFSKNNKIKTFIFSPYNKISNFQFSQISSIIKKNIFNVKIKGNFDDCQKIVKDSLKNNFSTVNSINLIRILVQISYYLFAFLKIRKKINFFIPTGNFGNAYSCFILKKMGLPIKITIITNENDMLYNFFSKGIYENNRKTIKTDSPSMDISKSSNLERFIFSIFKNNKEVRNFFNKIKKKKILKISKFKRIINCGKSVKGERKKIINFFFKKKKYIFDTHTSNALAFYFKKKKNKENICILETAKSLKFLEEINTFLDKDFNSYYIKKYNIDIKKFCLKRKKFFYFNYKDKNKIKNFINIYSKK